MSVLQALDVGLAFLVFAVAAWTVFAPGAFAATVGYVVYGLLLSLVWIRLFAVDVALTEAAIGSGVTGVLLIGAAARLRGAETTPAEEALTGLTRLFAAGLCLLVAAALAAVVLLLPDQGPTLAPQSMERLPETGLGNPVTAVLIAFRSFDTMLEKVVLVLARGRRMVARRRPVLGRRAGRGSGGTARAHAGVLRPDAGANRHSRRRPRLLGRRR